jgi:hypothetical protein
MPDHLHMLVEGLDEHADLRRFAKMSKQRSGAAHALSRKSRLWQEGYWEKILRADEDPRRVVRYILENPVRANLARTPRDYPFTGSDVWNLADLLVVEAGSFRTRQILKSAGNFSQPLAA